MIKHELTRLGIILVAALLGIWGLEMLGRPGETVVIVEDAEGVGAMLVAKLRKERDSLAVLLAEERGEEPAPPVLAAARERKIPAVPVNTREAATEPEPSARGLSLAEELRRLAAQDRLLGVVTYDRALREKLPDASFNSVRERAEIRACIEALREANIARTDCNAGRQRGCDALELLSRDNRLSLAQQQMVYRLTEKL